MVIVILVQKEDDAGESSVGVGGRDKESERETNAFANDSIKMQHQSMRTIQIGLDSQSNFGLWPR